MRRDKKAQYYSKILESKEDQRKNIWKVANEVLYNKFYSKNKEIKIHEDGLEVPVDRVAEKFTTVLW